MGGGAPTAQRISLALFQDIGFALSIEDVAPITIEPPAGNGMYRSTSPPPCLASLTAPIAICSEFKIFSTALSKYMPCAVKRSRTSPSGTDRRLALTSNPEAYRRRLSLVDCNIAS